MNRRPSKAPSTALFILAILVAGGSFWGWRYWRRRTLERNEANAVANLKTLTVAQVDFRSNDRDDNRINDFWTRDVEGLYSVVPQRGPAAPIQLIEKALANADGGRPAAIPCWGYFFRVMEIDEAGNPYPCDTGGVGPAAKNWNTSKFAFCAYPAVYGKTGRWTFIVNEGNTILKVDTEGKPVLRFPSDPPLKGLHVQ